MGNFNYKKWLEIKEIAWRLQAISSLLQIIDAQIYQKNELSKLKENLNKDFDQSLNRLIDFLEEDLDDLEED
ncbi:MAG TPA: hypothetical protein V6C58_23410 [Allocoleopsis sp.]